MPAPSLKHSGPGWYREVREPFGGGVVAYTVTEQDMGKIITTRSATGTVTITLPDPGAVTGGDVIVYSVAAQTTVVKTHAAGKMVTFNDATASSVTLSTANQLIGTQIRMVSDGTSWLHVAAPGRSTATNIAVQTLA